MRRVLLRPYQLFLFFLSILIFLQIANDFRKDFTLYTIDAVVGSFGVVFFTSSSSPLLIGDTLVTLNGEPFVQSLLYMRTLPEGSAPTIHTEVMRDGDLLTLDIPITQTPSPFVQILNNGNVLVGLVFWAVGVLLVHFHNSVKRLAIFVLFLATSSVAIVLAGSLIDNSSLFAVASQYSIWIGVVLFAHFHLLYMFEPISERWHKFFAFAYVVGSVGYILDVLRISDGIEYSLNLQIGNLSQAMWIPIWSVFWLLLALILIYWAYRRTPSRRNQRGIGIVAVSEIIALAPLIILSLIPGILFGRLLLPFQLSFLFLIFIPIGYGYAIWRARFFQLERYISRTSTAFLTIALTCVLYLLITEIVRGMLPPRWSESRAVELATVLVAAAAFGTIRGRIQLLFDRLLYGGWYDYQSVVSQLVPELGGIVRREGLSNLLVYRLPELLYLRGAALFLPDEDANFALTESTFSDFSFPLFPLHGNLQAKLQGATFPLSQTELLATIGDRLSSNETDLVMYPQSKMWVPLNKQGKLLGVLVIGAHLADDPLTGEDKRTLNTIASSAAIAAENVQLVDALLQRAEEVNRLYSELLLTREEEQRRLSRELHDQVIQDLINLNYHLDPERLSAMVVNDQSTLLELHRGLGKTIGDLRNVCANLRPTALDDLSLTLAMEGYLEKVQQSSAFQLDVELPSFDESLDIELPNQVNVCLYRVLQEAISNIVRHADASHVRVALELLADRAVLTVEDNGDGFEVPTHFGRFVRTGHFGLAGMQERVHLVNGELVIHSEEGLGTKVEITISLDAIN